MLIGKNARRKAIVKPPFKGCVVVQGQTYPSYVDLVRESWEGYQIIFSTWDNTDKSHYREDDIVIYNPIPDNPGTKNLNLQKISTINGFLKARELGWDRALKSRSDFVTTTADGLFGLFDKTKLNLHGYWSGYITDFYMEGEIDDVITLFEVDINGQHPEWHLTKKLYESGLNKKSVCIVNKLQIDKADIRWERAQYWFSSHIGSGVVTDVLPEKWG
jgi:hypothetical protein